jgi:branched-chain amino acid transport system ATP-binding protein
MSEGMLLEIKDLHVRYGRAEALHGVSVSVHDGEVVSVIGANGAGKTTLLRAVSGLHKAYEGQILFQGKRIERLPGHKIPRVGIVQVPANRLIVATMTVLENLKLGAQLRRDREGIAQDLEGIYQSFPILKERRSQTAGELSGGQQQMLAVGRALMAKPKLLLMDEPSIGLSPLMVAEVGRHITDISTRLGVSILLVEQNARMALRLSHRAYVIELGRIVLEGESTQLAKDERVRKAYLGI